MNIVIMGESRSGKSMLSNLICKNLVGYNKISLDYLVMTFKKVFSNLDIDYYNGKENLFTQFVEEYFMHCTNMDSGCGLNYVLEGASFPKETILRLKQNKNTKVIFLGKTQISGKDFFNEIRKYEAHLETGGWTKTINDETLLSWTNSWIKNSIKNKQFCEENEIDFYDTSINQQEVLINLLNKIGKNHNIL